MSLASAYTCRDCGRGFLTNTERTGAIYCHKCKPAVEPTDDEIYNRPGVEGGIGYSLDDAPGSLGENDHRL